MKYSDAFCKKSSRILLGTTYFGSSICEKDAFSQMDRFRNLGGTHIDTARMYSDGKAEQVIGKWLRQTKAEEMIVSTKGGFPSPETPDVMRLKPHQIKQDVDTSLKSLGVDCIDFYWLHRDDINIPVCEISETMNELVKCGKIKALGASNWHYSRIDEANKYAKEHNLIPFSATQIRFSPAVINEEEKGLVAIDRKSFEYYKKINMPVVAFSSQAKGFFSKMDSLGKSGLSQKAYNRYYNAQNITKHSDISAIAKNHSCSVAAVINAAFCSFEAPEVFAIIGSSNLSQLEDSMSGADIKLENEEIQTVFKNII